MLRNLRKLCRLSRLERTALLQAALLLPLVRLSLCLAGFQRTLKTLERCGRRRSVASPPPGGEAQAVCRMVEIAAARLPIRTGCLPRSLVVWWLLRRRGVASEIRFGARREGAEVLGHAWVELPGGGKFDTDLAQVYSAFPVGSGQGRA